MTVVVGAERHESIDLALRYLGLGAARSRQVAVDDQGRIRLTRWPRPLRPPVAAR